MPKTTPKLNGRPYKKLTAKQKVFCAEYVKDLNATRAAMATGMALKSARATGYQWLNGIRNPQIAKEISRLMAEKMAKCEVDGERIIRELCHVGFFNPQSLFDEKGNLIDLQRLPEYVAKAIQSYDITYYAKLGRDGKPRIKEISYKFWNKLEALSQLAKNMGLIKAPETEIHTHSHQHLHVGITDEQLDRLPIEVRRQMLIAYRKARESDRPGEMAFADKEPIKVVKGESNAADVPGKS